MTIRSMRQSDISDVTRIGIQAFANDEAFLWLYPRHEQHPSGMYSWFLSRTRERLASPEIFSLVAETIPSDSDDEQPKVIAYAFYTFKNGLQDLAGEVPVCHPSWPRPLAWFESQLQKVQSWYLAMLDRAVDKGRLAKFWSIEFDAFDELGPHLHLALLGVDPAYQGKGVGSRMVKWGTDRAQEAGVAVSLESSLSARRTYQKAGFEIAEVKPLVEGLEACAMVWLPEKADGKAESRKT